MAGSDSDLLRGIESHAWQTKDQAHGWRGKPTDVGGRGASPSRTRAALVGLRPRSEVLFSFDFADRRINSGSQLAEICHVGPKNQGRRRGKGNRTCRLLGRAAELFQ